MASEGNSRHMTQMNIDQGKEKKAVGVNLRASAAPVTCVCPTYGRASLLPEAVAWFMLQGYEARELWIVNDAPVPIRCEVPKVRVTNLPERFQTLGHKRQWMLDNVATEVVAHWDDDDWYLPWHLEEGMAALTSGEHPFVQLRWSFEVWGVTPEFTLPKASQKNFDANMLFTKTAHAGLGGYWLAPISECRLILQKMKNQGLHSRYMPICGPSYAWRTANGMVHSYEHNQRNRRQDFGDGSLIWPADLTPHLEFLRQNVAPMLKDENMRARFVQTIDNATRRFA
jgi:hypothetical protein